MQVRHHLRNFRYVIILNKTSFTRFFYQLQKRIMSNPAFMSVCFEGEQRELRSLYGKMKQLQERKKPLVENSFYYPTRWLGNLVTRLGADWHDVYCRGTWQDITNPTPL
jgi:hypothetical protein